MKTGGKKKLVWAILFSVITIIMCYFFIVVYFYFISPYNISLRLVFWPFSSENQIGQMYKEAVVTVSFDYENEDSTEIEPTSATGVNIRKDGFILMPYSEIQKCYDEEKIKIQTKAGGVYSGKILFKSKEFNLAVLKCENANGSNNAIKIPYVDLTSSYSDDQRIIVSSRDSSWSAQITDNYGYTYVSQSGYFYSIEDGFLISVNGNYSFNGGAVFDKSAHLIGFSYGDTIEFDKNSSTLSASGEHFIMPTHFAELFIDEVEKAYRNSQTYENKNVEAFIAVDYTEAKELSKESRLEDDKISYQDKYYENSTSLKDFVSSHVEGVFLFEKFSKDEKTIPQNAVITSIVVDGDSYNITEKIDLYIVLYALEYGDSAKINYKIYNGSSYDFDSKTYTF